MSSNEMMNDADLARRIEFIGIDSAAVATLQALKPFITKSIGPGLDAFYAKVKQEPATSRFFQNPQHMTHAKEKQSDHWQSIVGGKFDEKYAKNVRIIGQTHARIGLEPRWYIGGYALVLEQLIHALVKEQWPRLFSRSTESSETAAKSLAVLVKAAMLDMDLAISIYLDALEQKRQEAERAREAAQQTQTVALSALTSALRLLANGDLTARLDQSLAPEFDALKSDFNSSIDKLEEALGGVAASISEMQSGTHEISVASDDLSRRTEQNAASLEQTAAALHEITSTVSATSDSVVHAQEAVSQATREADQAGQVVQLAVEAIGRIEKSSREMNNIIGVIDEIAFQTNLLALNAGVEAARAGESGRGFAVVASEVRALAQRSADAAKQIKSLIGSSSSEVAQGVKHVGDTGVSLGKILKKITEINSLVSDISAGARNQAVALQEVNSAVGQMDQATQQNAAMAEEATAASQSLAQESEQLALAIAQFKVRHGSAATKAAVANGASRKTHAPVRMPRQKIA